MCSYLVTLIDVMVKYGLACIHVTGPKISYFGKTKRGNAINHTLIVLERHLITKNFKTLSSASVILSCKFLLLDASHYDILVYFLLLMKEFGVKKKNMITSSHALDQIDICDATRTSAYLTRNAL